MRNIDRIRQMSLDELAPLLVKDETKEFNNPCYSSPSGAQCWTEVIQVKRIDYALQMIQLYPYKLPTVKIGNWIMDFRKQYTMR